MAKAARAAVVTAKAPVVQVELSRCKACGSTERGGYYNVIEQQYAGVDMAGKAYTHIVRRYCPCAKCGQVRIDRTYENRTAGARPAPTG